MTGCQQTQVPAGCGVSKAHRALSCTVAQACSSESHIPEWAPQHSMACCTSYCVLACDCTAAWAICTALPDSGQVSFLWLKGTLAAERHSQGHQYCSPSAIYLVLQRRCVLGVSLVDVCDKPKTSGLASEAVLHDDRLLQAGTHCVVSDPDKIL